MAHSMQMLSLLVEGFGNKISAVLLSSRIHEGLIFSNRDHRTLLDKMNAMFASTLGHEKQGFVLVADAYYSSAALLDSMAAQNGALLVRVRNNAVGYLPAVPLNKPFRGRPKKYGKRVATYDLFKARSAEFVTISSPIRDEEGVMTRYLVIDLLWKQLKEKVRFILSDHPTRGQCILMTNDWNLKPAEAIRLYYARFGIEMSFKALVHTVGGFDYHFWMKDMDKLKRGDGDQYLHRKDEKYRKKVRAKVNTSASDIYRKYCVYVRFGDRLFVDRAYSHYSFLCNFLYKSGWTINSSESRKSVQESLSRWRKPSSICTAVAVR